MTSSFRAGLAGMATACAALTVGAGAAQADKMTLRYSQWIPAAHFTQKDGLHQYFKEIEKATEGRVRILPSSKALGPPPRQMQITVDGITDVGWGAHGYQPGVYPLSEISELPFVTKNTEANSVAYWRVFKALLEKAGMHPKGVHTLALHVHPAGSIYNNKRPIKSVADFKGLKLRATNSTVFHGFKQLGAVPVSPAGGVTALHQGLSKGVMDGTSFTDEAIYAFHVAKYIKYTTHIPGGLYNTSFYLVINQKKWEAIAKKDQEAITKLSGEALAHRIGKLWDGKMDEAQPLLKKQGIEVHTADGELLAKIKSVMASVRTGWIAKAKKAGIDGEAALAMYQKEVEKAAAGK